MSEYKGEWRLDDLVIQTEMAEIAHVAKSSISMWRHRYPDFPTPIISKRRNVNLWSREEFEAWLAKKNKTFDDDAFTKSLNA